MNKISSSIGTKLALLVGVGAAFLGAIPAAHAADRIYWGNFGAAQLSFANLNGTGGGDFSSIAAANAVTGTAFWTAQDEIFYANSSFDDQIKVSKLDGSTGSTFVSATASDRRGMVIDAAANRVYWARESANQIDVANLGTGQVLDPLPTSGSAGTATISSPGGVAIDKSAGRIYWANGGDDTHPISWANLDGTGGGDLDVGSAPAQSAKGPTIDTAAGKIYWSNFGDDTHPIAWAMLDGTGGGSLNVSGATVSGAHGTALDPTAGKIYWTNFGNDKISYANLNGSGGGDLSTTGATISQPLFPSLLEKPVSAQSPSITGDAHQGQTLTCSGHWANDDIGALLYREPSSVAYQWLLDGSPIGGATSSTYELQAADVSHDVSCKVTASNFAGSANAESSAVTVGVQPSERIVWANFSGDSIGSADLTGGGFDVNTLATTVGSPSGTAIDTSTGRVYWANNDSNTIKYSKLDSTGGGGTLDTTGATVSNPRGLVVDQQTERIYWADESGASNDTAINYANLDGSGGGHIPTTGTSGTATVAGPSGVALDLSTGRIYWANGASDVHPISYATLNGFGGGDLDTTGATAGGARGVAIDLTGNKVYWTNFGNDTISYASLSGGSGGQLSTAGATIDQPHGLAIDHAAGKLYWANFSGGNISYANLNGSGGGDLNTSGATVSGALFPSLLEKPANTSEPEVTGTTAPGHTLDCSQGGWAHDDPGALLYRSPRTYEYQWLEDDTPISGETDSTYSVQGADAFHDIKCEVTASNDGGSASATSSAAHITGPAPANTTPPSISGTPAVGEVLTCNNGSWDGGSITYSYDWRVDGTATGQTDSTYTVQAGDLEHQVVCRVTATNPAGSTSADSAARTIQATPQNTASPSISGTPEQGSTLTCHNGTWSGGALSYGYEWLRDDVAIGGETNSTYQVQHADVTHTLKCRVTASNEIGSASATSSGLRAKRHRNARIFWADFNGTTNRISYANLDNTGDGGDLDTTGATIVNPYGVAIDSAAGRIYWLNSSGGDETRIAYANLDGTGGGGSIDASGAPAGGDPTGLAIDRAAGRVYWGAATSDEIAYANLDGSGGGTLTTTGATVDGPTGFAVDRASGRLYWTNTDSNVHPIAYANLDGSGGGDLNTTGAVASGAWGLAISGGKVYWANQGNSTISHANLSGGGGAQLDTTGAPIVSPQGLAIDSSAGKIYWPNGNNTIAFANLSGGGGATLDTSGTSITPSGSPTSPVLLDKPSNSVPPSISGVPSAGHALTCGHGAWPDDLAANLYRAPESYDYQWLKDNVAISGETGSTYSVQGGDTGHVIKCRVTATNLGGSTNATSAGATIQVPPANTALPSVSGTPVAGHTLTCNKGSWSGSVPQTYSYRWLRNGTGITGATSATYLVKSADVGKQLKCRVTATNNGGSATATSAAVLIKTPPKNTVAPKITGTPKVGKTLTCNKGTWTGSLPITYKYQWLRNGSPIAGATAATYVAKAADQNKFISCRVTAKNVAGQATKTSAAVKVT
jgi:DNA-binding beta-propeller fold protein YncE